VENIALGCRILLKRKSVEERGVGSCGSGYGQMAGCCKHGNEPSGCTKCGEFLDQLTNC
jgi:hypothetical protein